MWNHEFCLGLPKFEKLVSHPTGEIKSDVEHPSLESAALNQQQETGSTLPACRVSGNPEKRCGEVRKG